ncbi:pyrroloquinoline quinone precursor peptide PqqA [Kitasatospora sp. NPDC054939]
MRSTPADTRPPAVRPDAPARPAAAAKPAWTAPAVECHRTGAEVTAYAGRAAQWLNR